MCPCVHPLWCVLKGHSHFVIPWLVQTRDLVLGGCERAQLCAHPLYLLSRLLDCKVVHIQYAVDAILFPLFHSKASLSNKLNLFLMTFPRKLRQSFSNIFTSVGQCVYEHFGLPLQLMLWYHTSLWMTSLYSLAISQTLADSSSSNIVSFHFSLCINYPQGCTFFVNANCIQLVMLHSLGSRTVRDAGALPVFQPISCGWSRATPGL